MLLLLPAPTFHRLQPNSEKRGEGARASCLGDMAGKTEKQNLPVGPTLNTHQSSQQAYKPL